MKLSRRERARLAQRLISSLDQEVDVHAEEFWLQEAERRLDELTSGKVAGIPAEKVIRKAPPRFGEKERIVVNLDVVPVERPETVF